MACVVAHARSFLFVPASRAERLGRALRSGSGCVIVDLEDAVPPGEKDQARRQLADTLAGLSREELARILVRVNAAGTAWHDEDVQMLKQWIEQGLAGAMISKAEAPAVLHATSQALGPAARLVPLIESLAGLDAVNLLARVPQVARLALGHLDFQLDLGMRSGPGGMELAPVRFAIVAASRRAELPPPVDGVTIDATGSEQVSADARRARSFGFGAKLCIHPSQIASVEQVFAPSAGELEWARRVVSEAQARKGAAFSLDGRMVDLPVVRLAERILLHTGPA